MLRLNKKDLIRYYSDASSVWNKKYKKRVFSVKTTAVIVTWTIILLLFLQTCSALEVLPGLCYTDKEGTYLCEEENESKK